jgi:hypothetical protein
MQHMPPPRCPFRSSHMPPPRCPFRSGCHPSTTYAGCHRLYCSDHPAGVQDTDTTCHARPGSLVHGWNKRERESNITVWIPVYFLDCHYEVYVFIDDDDDSSSNKAMIAMMSCLC